MGLLFGFVFLFACLVVGCVDECPADFPGGNICGPDGKTVLSCYEVEDCFEPPCTEGVFLRESGCPTYAPNCVSDTAGQATCIGEILGTCETPGIVDCEDTFTEIRCADDGSGKLALQRGACLPGALCKVDPASGPSGCDPRY
ncbi:MAG TPA: hypothetical protein PK156_10105 [Polyangium sp.]|nr:hypothetical protein [Polyangium sp.]